MPRCINGHEIFRNYQQTNIRLITKLNDNYTIHAMFFLPQYQAVLFYITQRRVEKCRSNRKTIDLGCPGVTNYFNFSIISFVL